MTRYTNIGIKRTFFQAGFDDGGGAALSDSPPEASNSASSGVPEEKHKRNKKSIPSPSADGEGDVVRRAYEGRGKAKGEKSDMPDFSSKRVNVNATGYVKRKGTQVAVKPFDNALSTLLQKEPREPRISQPRSSGG